MEKEEKLITAEPGKVAQRREVYLTHNLNEY